MLLKNFLPFLGCVLITTTLFCGSVSAWETDTQGRRHGFVGVPKKTGP